MNDIQNVFFSLPCGVLLNIWGAYEIKSLKNECQPV